MIFSNKVYNVLKWVCIVFLPACGTLVFTLGKIYGWDWAETVTGTISAVDFFLGTLIGISTAQYNAKRDEIDGNK